MCDRFQWLAATFLLAVVMIVVAPKQQKWVWVLTDFKVPLKELTWLAHRLLQQPCMHVEQYCMYDTDLFLLWSCFVLQQLAVTTASYLASQGTRGLFFLLAVC